MPSPDKQPFLGTGWAFPVTFSKERAGAPGADCSVDMASDIRDIEQSLTILLTTRPGERVMRPDYGCSLEDLLFEPINESLLTYVRNLIDRSILYYEPRVKLNGIEILEDENLLEGRLKISVDITVRATNSRYNYVYDFYKREATIIAQ
ncbi:MAG: GPW/gp25 family protein [Phaeodactylibacter sp.]|nr:GPW/gp25 family protein [Phaeodactylibacter sp.]MCB9292679.1 GPW/gp25 family protein [Lewinellaceae bacterium]